MHEHADIRDAKLRQIRVSRTPAMAADQETTNNYLQVPESLLDAERHNRLRYVVKNTGANAIDAKVMGRQRDAEGNWTDWQDDPDPNLVQASLGANASTVLYTEEVAFDQYSVWVKASAGGSQGEANVIGKSFFAY